MRTPKRPYNPLPVAMEHLNHQLDEALKETFPASDPVAINIEPSRPEHRMTTTPTADPVPQDSLDSERNEITRPERPLGPICPASFSARWHGSVAALLLVWVAFGRNAHIGYLLAIVMLVLGAALGLPAVLAHMGKSRTQSPKLEDFLSSNVDSATERLTGAQAWIQMLIVSLSLALAALLIGMVYMAIA